MIWIAIVALLALAAAAAWMLRRTAARDRAASAPATRARPSARFGAVEIQIRGGACDPARALRGRRILARQAPALPLAACTAERCTCKFVKLSDRRTEDRRLERDDLSAAMFLREDKRLRRGRRDED